MRRACFLLLGACTKETGDTGGGSRGEDTAGGDSAGDTAPDDTGQDGGPYADVIDVAATGDEGAYTFAATVQSVDTGCHQYCDWWEVLSPAGELVYRRTLSHSHGHKQPFTRSSESPVEVDSDQEVVVRAHMVPTGYGGQAMVGTVDGGFVASDDYGADFVPELEDQEPLPVDCKF